MITMTDEAVSQVQILLREKQLSDHGLRLFVQGGGCAGLQYGLAFEDTEREGDTVLECGEVRLYVDGFSAAYLEGACIDYQETLVGGGFQIENPNAVASCACGSSFSTESGQSAP
jgi:iron-sulfur cluster assembly accessory protein